MTERKKAPPQAWKPGESGNPRGKPKGTRNRATMMVLSLMEAGAKEITLAVVGAAKAGDLTAAKMVIERLAPPMRERLITIDLPDVQTAQGIAAAQAAILQSAASDEITPSEAATLAGVVEMRRRALETEELERRIGALEESATPTR